MQASLWKLLGLFLALALLGFFATRAWQARQAGGRALVAEPGCDLASQTCSAALPGGGSVRLAITPHPIPLMQPLAVDVWVDNSALHPERLDISGLNMEMGLNRTLLQRHAAGHWLGKTILPICSQRRMHWQADLVLADKAGEYHLKYAFYTQH